MRHRLLSLFALSTLLGCSKSDSNPILDFGEGEGITYRTGQNFPYGPYDPTDWTSDGEWNKQERALFADLNLNLDGPQQPALISTIAYPNPSAGQAFWSMQFQRTAGGGAATYTVRGQLVDRNYRVLRTLGSNVSTASMVYALDYPDAGLSPNELYRLYYVVYNASGLVYRGHGDVRYNR